MTTEATPATASAKDLHERARAGDVILRVEDLVKHFPIRSGLLRRQTGAVQAVDGVSFDLRAGETLGLVGESGSGKSVTALSILKLVQPPGRIAAGRILFKGRNLLELPERELRRVRGAEIGFVFQEPMTALNPVHTVGDQLAEAVRRLTPETPIIMLTGFGDLMAARGEQPPGVDVIVSKPVTLSALRRALTQATLSPRVSPPPSHVHPPAIA